MQGLRVLTDVQVFNFHPSGAYNQSGYNQFMIMGSTGTNGLRDWVANASIPLFGLIITNQWTAASDMNLERTMFGFASMANSKVIVAGGVTENGVLTQTAEEYDPVADVWSYTANNISSPRQLNAVSFKSWTTCCLSFSSFCCPPLATVQQFWW